MTTLFNTIFGIRGEFIFGERVPFYVDAPTGLPVYSIFNKTRTAPSPEMMENVDVMVFDIKEAGVRYYEYLYILADLMKACAAVKKPLVVLDRVDPIGGAQVEGAVCPPDMHAMVGDYRLAIRTGMTVGEFARYVQGEFHAEKETSQGRVDCVMECPDYVYIFEFKRDGNVDEALKQIDDKGYAKPYLTDPRPLYKVGINFSTATGTVEDMKYVLIEQ